MGFVRLVASILAVLTRLIVSARSCGIPEAMPLVALAMRYATLGTGSDLGFGVRQPQPVFPPVVVCRALNLLVRIDVLAWGGLDLTIGFGPEGALIVQWAIHLLA